MDKEVTVGDYIGYFITNVCCYCHYYNPLMGVCGGEVLPIEKAILRILDGRGCCKDIKELAELLKEQNNEGNTQTEN